VKFSSLHNKAKENATLRFPLASKGAPGIRPNRVLKMRTLSSAIPYNEILMNRHIFAFAVINYGQAQIPETIA